MFGPTRRKGPFSRLYQFRRATKIRTTNSRAPFSDRRRLDPPRCVWDFQRVEARRVPPPQQCIGFPPFHEKQNLFRIFFSQAEGQSGGETRRLPRGPRRPHTRGKASARRPTTRFRRRPRAHGRFFTRNTTSDARALVSDRRATASRKSGATRKTGFSKVTCRLLLGRRTEDATKVCFL